MRAGRDAPEGGIPVVVPFDDAGAYLAVGPDGLRRALDERTTSREFVRVLRPGGDSSLELTSSRVADAMHDGRPVAIWVARLESDCGPELLAGHEAIRHVPFADLRALENLDLPVVCAVLWIQADRLRSVPLVRESGAPKRVEILEEDTFMSGDDPPEDEPRYLGTFRGRWTFGERGGDGPSGMNLDEAIDWANATADDAFVRIGGTDYVVPRRAITDDGWGRRIDVWDGDPPRPRPVFDHGSRVVQDNDPQHDAPPTSP